MRQLGQMKKSTKNSLFTYTLVIAAFVVVQALRMGPGVGAMLEGQLIPICAYIVMALALNLVVGVSGELSLGHAGFMSIGAFAGSALALALQSTVTLSPLRLALAMVFGAVIAAALGFLIGIPVLRLNGDYLAIVTLAFGEIIKSIITNVYLGVDENGLQFSFLSNKNELADGGVELIRGPMGVMNTQRISTFIAGFVLVLVALVVIFNLVNSRTGRAVMAARDNRIAAESVGISVTKYKMIAFVVSAALAGAAGLRRHQVRLQYLHSDSGVRGAGRPGQHVGLRHCRRRPHYPARGPAPVLQLPHAGVRHCADPGHAGHQQSHPEGLLLPAVPPGAGGRAPCGGGERRRQAVSSIKRPETKLVPVPSVNKIPERDVDKSPILEAQHLGIDFGGLTAVNEFNMAIGRTEIAGLIGPNGAGKTTVFNLLTKVYQPTRGTVLLDGVDTHNMNTVQVNKAGIARTFQNIRLFNNLSVEDNVKIGMHNSIHCGLFSGILRLPRYWKEEKTAHERALELLSIFHMQDLAGAKAGSLPYGANPSLLLLDEPAAGMNPSETAELMENIVKIRDTFQIAILLIEHDMNLVMGICEGICVLNFGQIIAKGTPTEIQNNPEVIKAYLGGGKEG